MKICVIAGHTTAGKGTGAVGYINESNENRIVGKKVVEYLNQAGHTAVYGEINKSDNYLAEQVAIANKDNYDLVVQIHFNANKTTPNPMGTETLYKTSNGKKYAEQVTNSLGKMYKQRGAKQRTDLYWLNQTKAPAILVEICFVDSKADTDKYISNKYYTAKLIAEGITGQTITENNNSNTSSTNNKLYAVCTGAYNHENAKKMQQELIEKGYKDTYLIPR